MKKIISISMMLILCMTMLFALGACGTEKDGGGSSKDRSEAGSPDPFTPEDYGVHSGFAEPDESGADLSRTGIYDRKNFTGGYSNGHDYDRDWRDDE